MKRSGIPSGSSRYCIPLKKTVCVRVPQRGKLSGLKATWSLQTDWSVFSRYNPSHHTWVNEAGAGGDLMVLDKFIREAAGHFIWLLNIVFVWFKQCQHQHAAAWSYSVLLAGASVKRYCEGDAVCSVCSCLGSSCPLPLVRQGARAGVNPAVQAMDVPRYFLHTQDDNVAAKGCH